MYRICPLPPVWHSKYEQLREAASNSASPPPMPLILAGGGYSNDLEKKKRWDATVQWADRHGLGHILSDLRESDMYRVEEIAEHAIGPLGGQMHLDWNFEPKIRPSDNLAENLLSKLKEGWRDLVGMELGSKSHPLSFSGSKLRKLIVNVESGTPCRWGQWTELPADERRRKFTELRKAVNAQLEPHHVDHIEFVEE